MAAHRAGRTSAAIVALLVTAGLVGCTPAGTSAPATSAPPPPTTSAPTPIPTPTPEPLALTCDAIVSDEMVIAFADAGWTGQPRGDGPWTIGDQSFPDGIVCQWMADHSVGTDDFAWYGWSPVDAALAAASIASLTSGGEFFTDETPDGVYVTIDPDIAPVTDENGYGMTYLFADGWVGGAGTRADLVHLRVPADWTPGGS